MKDKDMTKDRDEKDLKVGDFVYIPCVVKATDYKRQDGVNITLETTEPHFPSALGTEIYLNSKQVVKQ